MHGGMTEGSCMHHEIFYSILEWTRDANRYPQTRINDHRSPLAPAGSELENPFQLSMRLFICHTRIFIISSQLQELLIHVNRMARPTHARQLLNLPPCIATKQTSTRGQ